MRSSKLADAIVTVLLVLFALWVINLVLGFGLGLLGLAFGLVSGLLGLLFSKPVMTLAAIGLVVYLISRRDERPRHADEYYNY